MKFKFKNLFVRDGDIQQYVQVGETEDINELCDFIYNTALIGYTVLFRYYTPDNKETREVYHDAELIDEKFKSWISQILNEHNENTAYPKFSLYKNNPCFADYLIETEW